VVHHAVIDIADDLAVTQTARLLRHAQIAGIQKADELGRLMMSQAFEFGVWRRFSKIPCSSAKYAPLLRQAARRISAVAIGAAEHDIFVRPCASVRRLDGIANNPTLFCPPLLASDRSNSRGNGCAPRLSIL